MKSFSFYWKPPLQSPTNKLSLPLYLPSFILVCFFLTMIGETCDSLYELVESCSHHHTRPLLVKSDVAILVTTFIPNVAVIYRECKQKVGSTCRNALWS